MVKKLMVLMRHAQINNGQHHKNKGLQQNNDQ